MKRILVLTVLAAAAMALSSPALAGPIYMKYEGIQGSVTAAGHGGWIEIHSVQFGVPPPAAPAAPAPAGVAVGGGGRVALTKRVDKASPLLTKAAAAGRLVPAVQIDVQKGAVYLRYELKNVMVSSFSVSGQGAGDPIPTESLSLNFTKIEFAYPEQKAPPSGAPALTGYSLSGAPKTPTPSKGTTTQAPARR